MATALQLPPPDTGLAFNEVVTTGLAAHDYPNALNFADFDLKDNRYPSLGTSCRVTQYVNSPGRYSNSAVDPVALSPRHRSWIDRPVPNSSAGVWVPEKLMEQQQQRQAEQSAPLQGPLPATNQQPQPPMPRPEDTLSRPMQGSPSRLAERFSRDEELQRIPSKGSDSPQEMGQRTSSRRPSQDQYGSFVPSSPRHPSLPVAGFGAGPSSSPIVPVSAGPSYNPANMQIPISPKPRAYAQHPTYITPTPGANVYAPPQVPKEEVCVECAMRDQDMADVDVASPGAWERDSDVLYDELIRREQEDEAAGTPPSEHPNRPRARGGRLTEESLHLWLSLNPKEPSSRQQTLDQYVRSQRTLLEAEVLAHARAMRESRQLDDKVRDACSQLRRSAYDLNVNPKHAEDASVKASRSSSMPGGAVIAHTHGHSRDVTLLENGMIVEHVDVRKEEKEERERRRKEERLERSRVRKSSRGSAIDVTSVYSMPIPNQLPKTDSGFFSGARASESRYSQSFSPRPSSVLTTGNERPLTSLRATSQASFSDIQSIGSTSSPRRSRFFGFKNLTSGFRSQDSLAPSGSMVDMHIALSREQHFFEAHPELEQEFGSNAPTVRLADAPQQPGVFSEVIDAPSSAVPKKKIGLKKIWKIVTGSKNSGRTISRAKSRSLDRAEDDLPLAPPPPLSYLVDREQRLSSRRHVSTPSLPSSASPNAMSPYAPSPPTAPSSLVPSPSSSRQPITEKENLSDGRKDSGNYETDHDHIPSADVNSPEQDPRGRTTHSSSKTLSSYTGPITPVTPQSNRPQSVAIRRDKSLPPLPGESSIEFPNHPMPDARPQTMYTYDPLMSSYGKATSPQLLPPQAPFRSVDTRRQSFGGMASQPHPAVRTLPAKAAYMRGPLNVPPFLAEERYGEFGVSHLSLNQWNNGKGHLRPVQPQAKPKQRRSRFGLASLFGRKSQDAESKDLAGVDASLQPIITHRTSASGEHSAGYGGPGSAHSSTAMRMSVTSRKNIAELVDQDNEFVAYRYPSTDQRFDLR
ncbi:hypothetical protein SCP_0309110 [Sparassis crispa]|uniref:Uncharacterized protein n=1 Tax=Sparassis crispa TaxID=139825 RepID=A0A401GG67_9APHY|nr:hypothetical protein SCP_0309110 [Sparassis crispa]GBE81184.1 hypothetical protein SCP_0309110 [Sparassis crispa]